MTATTQERRLHLGCGLKAQEGWVNLDGSWNAWLAKYPVLRSVLTALCAVPKEQLDIPWSPGIVVHDVRKPLPFQGDSFSAAYASHLLEHLYLKQAQQLLEECFRVLRCGGVLRVVVPDLKAIILEYAGGNPFDNSPESIRSLSPADRVNRRLSFRDPEPPSGNILYKLYALLNDFHSHKWMYDADSAQGYLRQAGFVEIREMPFHKSRIQGIEEVEEAGRVLHGAGICIEGLKPLSG